MLTPSAKRRDELTQWTIRKIRKRAPSPWNKGNLIGTKPYQESSTSGRSGPKRQVEERTRNLAMFDLAIDSKVRGCDVFRLKVEDVPEGRKNTVRHAAHL
jgi:hypothetical protein